MKNTTLYVYDPAGEKISTGFITDMPNDVYHKRESISKSGLDKIDRSPAHFQCKEYKEPTRLMEIGTAIHTAVLEPRRFEDEYLVTAAEKRTEKIYKEAKSIVGSEFALTIGEAKKINGMKEAVNSNLAAVRALTQDGLAELTAVCVDPETGVQMRCRYDWLTDSGIAVDLKKTQDMRPDKFRKSVENYRYHVQAAMYSFIYKEITGEKLQAFYFLAVEEDAPHSTAMYELDDEAFDIGHFYFRRDLRTYADCLEKDIWPHPDDNAGSLGLSNWTINSYEDDLEVLL